MLSKLVEIHKEAERKAQVEYPAIFSRDGTIEKQHLIDFFAEIDDKLQCAARNQRETQIRIVSKTKTDWKWHSCDGQPFRHMFTTKYTAPGCRACGECAYVSWIDYVDALLVNLGTEHRMLVLSQTETIIREFLAAFVKEWRMREGSAPIELVERDEGSHVTLCLRFWWLVNESLDVRVAREQYEKLDAARLSALRVLNELRIAKTY